MDVKPTFLIGIIKEEVYIEQPQGLYGLKHAPKAWYSRIYRYLLSMDFTKSEADPNLYFILVGTDPLILVLYVDDLFLTGAEELIIRCKANLTTKFEMKGIGLIHYFLGLEVC